ncbi:MAG: prepilin-type N-terminal cleavage/methylation domain-containing protein [Candidatus Omnitrophica bacterium]|nr:prepilin-type N-terminal cleavage/methylation domain-containing protein [Candidatus Omnitrophota bacterium]
MMRKTAEFGKKRQKGFTLVELVLASTLTALILGSAFVSLSTVLKAYKELGGKTNLAETARLILDRMRADLEMTFYSPHADYTRFVGYDQLNGDLPADSLTFISSVNNPVNTGGGSSDLAEVQYYIDVDDGTPERWLLRRMDYTPDSDPFTGGELALLGPRVASIDFQYFDGIVWQTEWDSSEAIPIAVNITIGLFEADHPEETPTLENLDYFSTSVWIACYRESEGQDAEASGEQ